MKVLVLGAGLVGAPMAEDLAKDKDFKVTVVDNNGQRLHKISQKVSVQTIKKDLCDIKELKQEAKNHDIVLSAVPGFMGYKVLKAVIEAKINIIDIAFSPEDHFKLDDLAKKNNVIAITDIGVAPGMSNILTAYAYYLLDKTYSAKIYVGGLPKKRNYPWEYKAVFSPVDVIEEYTRPARFVKKGKIISKPALSDPELIEFPYIGELEAFNSDGLRSLLKTMDIPDMIEKTLRYPGHIEKIKLLKQSGFFNKKEIDINGIKVSPIDFTSKLLFPKWKLKKNDEDITIMSIIIEGEKAGKKIRYKWFLYDEYNKTTATHSMARTTGYTATAALRMLAKRMYNHTGISPPEFIGKHPGCVKYILKELEEKGVIYKFTTKKL